MIALALKILLSVLLFYSSFVSVYINIIKKQYDSSSLFFSFSLCSLCLLIFYHVYQNIKTELSKKDSTNIIKNTPPPYFLALCLASLVIGFFNIQSQYSRGLTEEESYQFQHSNQYNPLNESYKQQQPPLDYYFSAFSGQLFHMNKFSVRFHTMLFYLLLCFALPFGLYYYSSFLPAILGCLLFLINHIIRLHAVDARPLNLALLTGFLFLFFYIQFFQSKQKESLIPIISSQYLFILSIGLQPVIFIITLFLSSFLLFFNSQKETVKKLFLSHIATAVLACPFYLKMLSYGNSTSKFREVSWSSILHYLNEWNLNHLTQKYFFNFYDKMLFSFLFLLLTWALLVIFKKIKPDKKTLLLLLSAIIFPIIFDSLFSIGIWYSNSVRFFIIFSLFLIFCFVSIYQDIKSFLKHKKYYSYILISFLILFSSNSYLQFLKIQQKTQFNSPYENNSIEKVYHYLKKKGTLEDFFMEISLRYPLSGYSLDLKQQKIFFHDSKTHPSLVLKWLAYTEKSPFFYENNNLQIFYIDWNPKFYKNNQKVFLISNRNKKDISEEVLSHLLPKKIIGRFVIFELTLSSKNKEKEYIHFLYTIKDKTPTQYQSSLLETLLYYSYKKQNKAEFNKLLAEYKNLKNYLPEYNPRFNYPIHFDLQRRVKFFESLSWN